MLIFNLKKQKQLKRVLQRLITELKFVRSIFNFYLWSLVHFIISNRIIAAIGEPKPIRTQRITQETQSPEDTVRNWNFFLKLTRCDKNSFEIVLMLFFWIRTYWNRSARRERSLCKFRTFGSGICEETTRWKDERNRFYQRSWWLLDRNIQPSHYCEYRNGTLEL